jgi:hypothetical protein
MRASVDNQTQAIFRKSELPFAYGLRKRRVSRAGAFFRPEAASGWRKDGVDLPESINASII